MPNVPQVVYWCNSCKIPLIRPKEGAEVNCPLCGESAAYMCADIRPVFPEERLLLELLCDSPLINLQDSVWATGSKYYINGKSHPITVKQILSANPSAIRSGLLSYESSNSSTYFDEYIEKFILANRERLNDITIEACEFIRDASEDYEDINIVISFSGGKDSSVVADLVVRALSNPYLVHIFGDTTLEFPFTYEYAKRFRASHPLAIFKTAKNQEQNFYDAAAEIGPPSRIMRWCCSMFKTGPITRIFNSLYGNESIITFQGVRSAESVSRSKYNRIEDSAESVKIQKQKVALPIFYWNDIDVWLYILAENIDFNKAYRLGYERVGCWCCPNNNPRAEFLSKIYMPEEAQKWNNFLIAFAREIGKPDAEVYVSEGKWKARQGGNGLAAAASVKTEASRCATEDNAMIFSLARPYSDELVNLFTPIGKYAPGLGRKLLDEKIFVDLRTGEPVMAAMPFSQSDYEYAAKIRVLGTADIDTILRMAKYQITKFNACRQCLKCESLCKFGAISINGDSYEINADKCTRCKQCVTDKYLEGGCLMKKYLKTKE